eukprot:762916-Hanusia_phi.AAC.2
MGTHFAAAERRVLEAIELEGGEAGGAVCTHEKDLSVARGWPISAVGIPLEQVTVTPTAGLGVVGVAVAEDKTCRLPLVSQDDRTADTVVRRDLPPVGDRNSSGWESSARSGRQGGRLRFLACQALNIGQAFAVLPYSERTPPASQVMTPPGEMQTPHLDEMHAPVKRDAAISLAWTMKAIV